MTNRNKIQLLALLPLALACAATTPGFEAIPLDANPADQIDGLAEQLSAAQQQDVDALAPTWFRRANRSLRSARDLHARGGSVEAILTNVAEGRAQLQQAEDFARVSQMTLAPVIRARGDARSAGAVQMEGYADVEEKFVGLGAAVENDDRTWAKQEAPAVERQFRELELSAIKKNTMERISDLIAKARSEGAEKLTPITLEQTVGKYRQLDDFITKNRYAREATTERANAALFEANRLVHLTQEAKAAQRRSPEEAALRQESLVVTLADALDLSDQRSQNINAQSSAIETAIGQLRDDRQFLADRVELLRSQAEQQEGTISLLRGENEQEQRRIARLEAERRFNNRFAEVSARFSSDEAEVYKKEQKLVIRLRSIQFPVGSTVVLTESYPLMAKVQRAIQTFPEPRVVIEGHTDSTGSTEVNDRISQLRAEAVKAYLTANNTVPQDRIVAVGKGFSEPLASDRTPEGRAQNRRIDVVIDAREPDLDALPAVGAAAPSGSE